MGAGPGPGALSQGPPSSSGRGRQRELPVSLLEALGPPLIAFREGQAGKSWTRLDRRADRASVPSEAHLPSLDVRMSLGSGAGARRAVSALYVPGHHVYFMYVYITYVSRSKQTSEPGESLKCSSHSGTQRRAKRWG